MKNERTAQVELVAFVGPSLPVAEARALAPCLALPPARQGDVWRALALQPRAIALIDGVFEAQPSVWHREILGALDAGVAVFGGASMGALRAAELSEQGMVGVGRIFGWYRDGLITDDAEVALLHAGPEHGHRPLTLPLVNVRHAAQLAKKARVLNTAEADALVAEARGIFYQDRAWPAVLAKASPRWRPNTRARWDDWARGGLEDLKRRDARECLQAAAAFVKAHAGRPAARAVAQLPAPSSQQRRRRLREGASAVKGQPVSSGEVVQRLWKLPESEQMSAQGLRRALLAGWARELGLRATADDVRRAEARWLEGLGVAPDEREAFLAASGLDEAQAFRLCEDLALETLVLQNADRLLSDGPSAEEGLAIEGRLSGLWADAARDVARERRRGARGNRGKRG
ncbi:MAG TPA: TfuA-like protein [Longimicrobium sp.]|nr:TfuA-like protein [Longimicrobium sp.]